MILCQRFACWSKRPTWVDTSIENYIFSCRCCRCWSFAVVGLIDQQLKFAVLLPIAKMILCQRFACWSKRPTWVDTSIENYIFSCRCCRCWSFAVVGLIDQQLKFAVLLPIAKMILCQRFACWSKRPTWVDTSIENYIFSCRCCRCWSFAVVGLIDQQLKFAVLLPIAKMILCQRFACWSKRPTWVDTSIENYIFSCRCCRCWSY